LVLRKELQILTCCEFRFRSFVMKVSGYSGKVVVHSFRSSTLTAEQLFLKSNSVQQFT